MATMFRCGFLAVAAAAAIVGQATLGGQQAQYDLLIRYGSIVDGTGNPWFAGDVAVRGDRIAAIGRLSGATAAREIDARGLVVAPGFIDLHTHSDQGLLNDGSAAGPSRDRS
jgi:N-acyl-D-aspartate/D-glutamate deacylase